MSIFDSFVGKYELSRTLRFELKPILDGKVISVSEFVKRAKKGIFEQDFKRDEEYFKIKAIFDDYYRYFINERLSLVAKRLNSKGKHVGNEAKTDETLDNIEKINFDDGYAKYLSSKKGDKKDIHDFYRNAREKVAQLFNKKEREKFGLDKYTNLYGKENQPMEKWLLKEKEEGKISGKDYEDNLKTLELFSKYKTFFTKYQQNRENAFDSKAKHGSIAYRIIDENLNFYYANWEKFQDIRVKYPDLWKKLNAFANIEDTFSPKNYLKYISQKFGDRGGIDGYNTLIGRNPENVHEKGINQLINEYKEAKKVSDISGMSALYKGILSKEDKIVRAHISTYEELFKTVEEDYNSSSKNFSEIVKLFKKYPANQIYINKALNRNLTSISNDLTGDYSVFKDAVGKFKGKEVVSIEELQTAYNKYKVEYQREDLKDIDIYGHFSSYGEELLKELKELYKDYKEVKSDANDKKKCNESIYALMEKMKELERLYVPFRLKKQGKDLECDAINGDFYQDFIHYYDTLLVRYGYDLVRNYMTKKEFSTDKVQISFDTANLCNGWDLNKEADNRSIILIKDGLYYLGIMGRNAGDKKLFGDEILRTLKVKDGEKCYKKMVYKQLASPNRMFCKVFFSKKGLSEFKVPDEIKKIKDKKLYSKSANDRASLNRWIEFCTERFKSHPEWSKCFDVKFKKPEEYKDINDFSNQVEQQCYKLTFRNIPEHYINEAIKKGQLYLFEIYNKDFSQFSKGTKNMHTLYWEAVFSKENLKMNPPVFKLNGGAEIFYRKSSISLVDTTIHEANIPIKNRNENLNKKVSVFKYDLIKNRRYCEDKLFFHCPISINFSRGDINDNQFNQEVNKVLKGNNSYNIIGIDRGERHLVYYVVINTKGDILEQGSFNKINKDNDVLVDYHDLLNQREKERKKAQKSWREIEPIKDLKSGYLSQVINKLTALMVKYNAAIIMENLNSKFKDSRKKIEKQVYQNFEKALINKLNYLVFKKNGYGEGASLMRGYQLSAPFKSFKELKRQTGFVYYVDPKYTSQICPKTGFVNLIGRGKINKKPKEFIEKLDSLRYNKDKGYFEILVDFNKFANFNLSKAKWTICMHEDVHYNYDRQLKEIKPVNIVEELKKFLKSVHIDFSDGENILPRVLKANLTVTQYRKLCRPLKYAFDIRFTKGGSSDADDFISSPVADKDGVFFDSRKASDKLPKNADANGAYHIALKGLYTLKHYIGADNEIEFNKNQLADFLNYRQK